MSKFSEQVQIQFDELNGKKALMPYVNVQMSMRFQAVWSGPSQFKNIHVYNSLFHG